MISLIQFALSLIMLSMLAAVIVRSVQRGIYVSYVTLFSIMLIADVFLPGILGALTGKYLHFSYFAPAEASTYLASVAIFAASGLFFSIGYLPKIRFSAPSHNRRSRYDYTINQKWLSIFFAYPIVIILLNLYFEFAACGSWEAFYNFKITRAYLVTIEYNTLPERIVRLSSEFSMTILYIATSIGFMNCNSLQHRRFWKIAAPLIAFALSLTTLYRGTIIAYACMMSVSLQLKNGGLKSSPRTKRFVKRIIVIGAAGFVVYGAVRTNLTVQRWGYANLSFHDSVAQMLTETLGTSLVALTRCLEYLKDGGKHFWGQSIYEMFYSLIPRRLWSNKPSQYGIITITKAMGSPATTMDAVSIPGELIVNFGLLGLLLLPLIGFIFRQLERMRESGRFKYLYAATISGFVTTSMWMSFSGFFPKIKCFPVYIIVTILIVKKSETFAGELNVC